MADKWRYAKVINCPTNINFFHGSIIPYGLPVKRKHGLPINHAATKLFVVQEKQRRYKITWRFLTPFIFCQRIPLREDAEKPFSL